MEKKKSREQIEKERTEYLDLIKKKQELEQDPTKKPAQRISGWNSKLESAKKARANRNRMNEKQTIVRRKMP